MTFLLKFIRERYYICREVEGMTLFLAGGSPKHHWSTDITDARVFQYKREALLYVLQNTTLRKLATQHGDYTLTLDYGMQILYISYRVDDETFTYRLPASILSVLQNFITPEDASRTAAKPRSLIRKVIPQEPTQ